VAYFQSRRDESVAPRPALAEFARQGVERLLVIKLKSYAEMDLADLLRFHCERRNPVTEAQDARGQLGVVCWIISRCARLGRNTNLLPSTDSGRTPYQFSGYAKRILSARERQELVGDGLTGPAPCARWGPRFASRCGSGRGESRDSVRVIGPTYIGARTIVRAGATIGPFASVERDCVVDCGTTVERSTVLPDTYLAPGLLIRHGLVDGGYLEDLGWGAVADLQPAGLGSRIQRRESRRQAFSQTATDVLLGQSEAKPSARWTWLRLPPWSQPWLRCSCEK
jgi:hypothetical protein